MAFGDSGILDNFNRANGALGASWSSPVYSGDGALVVSGNQCTPNAAGFHDSAWGTSFSANQEVFATVVSKNANTDLMYLFARLVNLNGASLDGYILIITVASGTDTWEIRRIDNAVETTLGASFTQEIGAGDAIGLRCNGTSIEAWYRASGGSWTRLATRTDSTYNASGQIGLGANTASTPLPVFDDFGGGVIVDDVIEQEGFRFGADDGSESAHGWLAAQDTNVTQPLSTNILLRMLVNVTTGDPVATAYTLRAQKNGAGGYAPVPIVSVTSPTLAWGAQGTIAYSASGGTTVSPTYPTGITPLSGLVLVVGQKPSTANGGSVTTPSGWTLRGSLTGAGGYGTTLGVDTGNTNVFVYTKDTVTGSETGTLAVTVGTNNVCWANIYRIDASDTATWSYEFGSGEDTAAGDVSITTGNMALAAGDFILAGMVIPTDVTTPSQFSAHALAQTGTTFGTVTEIQEPDSATGNDIGGYLIRAPVSSGSGSGAVTMTATAGGTTTNVRGPGFVLRLRVASVTNQLYIAASSNIAAGGEATTARLTAPSGKSTSDFVTGRRWDDENGTDTIDITSLDYTEVEWCVRTQSPAANGDYWDFRVYAGETALATYTVTPRWNVGVDLTVSEAVAPAIAPPLSESVATGGGTDVTVSETVAPALALPVSESVGVGTTLAETLTPALAATTLESVSTSGDVTVQETITAALALPVLETVALSVTVSETVAAALAFSTAREFVTTADNALRFYGHVESDRSKVRIEVDSPADPLIDVGASDFTYEFWMRAAYADNTSASIADARYSNIILDRDIWGHERGWVLGVTRRSGPILAVCWAAADTGGGWATTYGTTDVGDNVWHHIALTWRQSTRVLECYVDGVSQGTRILTVSNLSYPNGERPASGANNPYLVIGGEKHGVGVAFTGRFDELRISNSRRYTAGFTRPSAPFSMDANTVGLFHFDEGSGTVSRDASGVYIGEDAELLVGGSPSSPEWVAADVFGGATVTEAATLAASWPVSESLSTGATVTESTAPALALPAGESASTGTTVSESAALALAATATETVVTGIVVNETTAAALAWAAAESIAATSSVTLAESAAAGVAAWPVSETVITGIVIAEVAAPAWSAPVVAGISTGATVAEAVSVAAAWPVSESLALGADIAPLAAGALTWPALESVSVSASAAVSETALLSAAWPVLEGVDTSAQDVARYVVRPRRGLQVDASLTARLAPRKGKRITS